MTETETKTPGTDLDQWTYAHAQLTEQAQQRFSVAEMRTIRNAVMPTLNGPEFQMVLAMAARYDLDPLAKEIWGVKGKPRDGKEGRVLILVGRDGLLKVARRDAHFMGFDADVVRAKDEFRVQRSRAGREIIHNYSGSDVDRGEIVGAWAQVYVKGMHDVYFYAPMSEYKPSRSDSFSPWLKQPSVMIQKCALSLCLRLAFNLAGILAEEEADRVFEAADQPSASESVDGIVAMLRESLDDEAADRFLEVFSQAQRYRPGMVTAAAAQMSLTGVTGVQVFEWLDRENRLNAEAAAKMEQGAPVDAELVPDGESFEAQVLDELDGKDVDHLQLRLSDLYDRRDGDLSDSDAELLDEEIRIVEERFTAAGGELP